MENDNFPNSFFFLQNYYPRLLDNVAPLVNLNVIALICGADNRQTPLMLQTSDSIEVGKLQRIIFENRSKLILVLYDERCFKKMGWWSKGVIQLKAHHIQDSECLYPYT
jgi:hypothetical protein